MTRSHRAAGRGGHAGGGFCRAETGTGRAAGGRFRAVGVPGGTRAGMNRAGDGARDSLDDVMVLIGTALLLPKSAAGCQTKSSGSSRNAPGRVKPNAFREFGVLVPEGHGEKSPAFQRWVVAGREASPGGTIETWISGSGFCRPSGTLESIQSRDPALKRRAIVECPSGTDC